jgi:CRP-like cAMP-binding protein
MMPTVLPSAISAVMRNVLLSSNSILSTPEPTVESVAGRAGDRGLAFRVRDFGSVSAARNKVYDLVYRHAGPRAWRSLSKEAGSLPSARHKRQHGGDQNDRPAPRGYPSVAGLPHRGRQALAETMTRKTYRKGEVLVEEGAQLSSLVIIRTGVVVVSCHSEEGELELRRLAPGDYFGESGLLPGICEPATIRALTFTVVYEVGQAALAKLIQDRPSIADEISVTLSRRAKAAVSGTMDERNIAATSSISLLVSRFRQLFEVPHG